MNNAKYGSDDASRRSGAIREAGGAFGKREAAAEEQYFRKVQSEQLHDLKDHMQDEITFHEEQIKRHQQALNKVKDKLDNVEKSK